MRVDGGGKVVVQRGLGLSADIREHIEQVHLYVSEIVWVASELRVEPAYVRLFAGDLPREQVRLVEKQDDGDTFEVNVVHDRVEDI